MGYYASYDEVIFSFSLACCDTALLPPEANVSTHRRRHGDAILREGVEGAVDIGYETLLMIQFEGVKRNQALSFLHGEGARLRLAGMFVGNTWPTTLAYIPNHTTFQTTRDGTRSNIHFISGNLFGSGLAGLSLVLHKHVLACRSSRRIAEFKAKEAQKHTSTVYTGSNSPSIKGNSFLYPSMFKKAICKTK